MAKKTKKKKVEQKSEVFYVGLSDPIHIRRSILEASKDLVQNIQRFDKFCAVRREKRDHMSELKSTVSEISRLISRLKNDLPSVPSPPPPPKPKPEPEKKVGKPAPKPKQKQKPKPEPIKLKPHEQSELHRLEAELNEIESKLSGL